MRARSRELVDRAVHDLIAAIDVYNKQDFFYRDEAFTILAVNARELLLKAKWLADHGNRIQSLYVNEARAGGSRPRYKRTRSGAKKTHGMEYLVKKLVETGQLHPNALKNLEALIEFRDTAVHFYHRSPAIAEHVLELGLASVKNFTSAANNWFDEDLSWIKTYTMPLTINPIPRTTATQLSRDEKAFGEYLESLHPNEEDPASPYAFAVNIEVRFVRSKAAEAFPVRVTRDPNETAVRLKEE